MWGVFIIAKGTETQEKSRWERMKRGEIFQRSEFIAVVSCAFHRFTLRMYVEEGEEVSTTDKKAYDFLPEVSTAP